jgi:AraC-like DNA-binding protein
MTAEEGDIMLIPAWEPHGVSTKPSGLSQSLVIQFLPDFLRETTIANLPWLSLFARSPQNRPRLAPEYRVEVLNLARRLQLEFENKLLGWEDSVRATMIKLFVLLARSSQPSDADNINHHHHHYRLLRIMPAVEMIYRDPSRRFTLKEGAHSCGLSIRQFTAVFRETMGVSFAKFCVQVRVKCATALLHGTDLPIDVIAERTGFTDHSHFSKAFSRIFKLSPTAYRREWQRMA